MTIQLFYLSPLLFFSPSWLALAAAPAVPATDGSWGQFLIWSGVLIVALAAGAIVIALLRKRFASAAEETPEGFTLEGLRRLHAQGELSTQEFQQAKRTLIEKLRAPSASTSAASTGRSPGRAGRADKRGRSDATDDASPHGGA